MQSNTRIVHDEAISLYTSCRRCRVSVLGHDHLLQLYTEASSSIERVQHIYMVCLDVCNRHELLPRIVDVHL